ncbi:MAG: 4-(cytidine 5'-diphospho)-2-C-methyl-D-erythritol kinase, partial [Clostridiales bacterium]|nr:4-(cytidine 5'-diphospho)-2-C-methyl-D-erythritol kinase [Clostridiales bacterium]
MNAYTIDAPAKINWYLNIGKKRPDGYHDIQTVMQTVPLCDTLRFAKRNDNEI